MTVRVETVNIGDEYCAVFRRVGHHDELLVDDTGKPRKFATASEALRAGRKALAIEISPPLAPDDDDVFGIRAWRAEKEGMWQRELKQVFGDCGSSTIERNGRTIVIERKRRR